MSCVKPPGTGWKFAGDDSAIKTLWLMICNIEDKRAAKRAKQVKRSAPTSGRLIDGRKVTNFEAGD